MENSRLLDAIVAIAQSFDKGEDGQRRTLLDFGFDEAEAHRIVAFVPLALGRPILEKLGVTVFSDVASVPLGNGEWLDVQLANQPEYVAALSAARDHMANGTLPHEAFKTVALGSSDVAAVSEALDKGRDVKGGAIATAFHDARLAKYVVR